MKPFRHLLILLCAAAALMLPLRASAGSDYIRLHIIARSDAVQDQVVKLCIRDDVRAYTGDLLEDCRSSDEAWQLLKRHHDELTEAVVQSARRWGFDGILSVDLGVFPFPDRTYADEFVPSGDYRALRISMGEGEGRNWWCVVYPSLCLPEDADTDRPIEFYSTLWRWVIELWEAIRA